MDANKLITIPAELLTEEVKDSIVKTAKDKVSDIDNRIALLEAEKLLWTNALSSVLNGSKKPQERRIKVILVGEDSKYPLDGRWIHKISFIIEYAKRPLLLSEIVNLLLEYEPYPYGKGTPHRTVITRVASLLSLHAKTGTVIRRAKVNKEFRYGLAEWFSDEETLLPEFQNKGQLSAAL
jgi:hypothetical protein